MNMDKQAVVLLSGGVDSATVRAIAKTEGFGLNAFSFRYGQRHEVELNAARRVGNVIRACLKKGISRSRHSGHHSLSTFRFSKGRHSEFLSH